MAKTLAKIISGLGLLASTIALSGCETTSYSGTYHHYPAYTTPKQVILIEQPRVYHQPSIFHSSPRYNHSYSNSSHYLINPPRTSNHIRHHPININPPVYRFPNTHPPQISRPTNRIPATHHPSYNPPSHPSRNSTFSAPAPRIRHTPSRSIRNSSYSRHR